MNTQTKEPRNFRPQYHYTPQQGWINDPNGLVYRDGTYHLFAQHCPDRNVWGPMHWIHATSQDLLTWKAEGVPLAPDEELGMIFSGSAIVDFGNTSGLAQNGNPMIAMFTHHGTCEQQSVAYSTDDIHFTKYAGNPIIPTKGQKDFRDPKVFENEIKHCKTAVIAAGDHVEFYASADFKAWRKTGEFGRKENTQQWIFECPDLFPLTTIDGITRWVLTASMIFPKETGGSRTLYYLGEFDGETFQCTEQYEQRLMVDEGYDNYAAVTFNGTKECIQLGWATSWTYANELPTQGYRGQMTCARKLSLCTTPAGLRLAAAPIMPAHTMSKGRNTDHICIAPLDGECFHVRITSDGPFLAEISNAQGECFRFGVDNRNYFFTDRISAGIHDFNGSYANGLYGITQTARLFVGKATLDVYFDHCLFELFGDEGVYVQTTLAFPRVPYQQVSVQGAELLEVGML